MKETTYSAEDIIKEWHDYEGTVVQLIKDFDAAVKKTKECEK